MKTIIALESLGYRFDWRGDHLHYRCLGHPPEEARSLLLDLAAHKAQAMQFLRERGHRVLIPDLQRYLQLHNYRAVKAEWPTGEPRPWLIVASDQDPNTLPICQRGRAEEESWWTQVFVERGIPDPEAE